MAKVKLGSRPKQIKRTVETTLPEGETGTIACVFKYRTRKEFGDFIDAMSTKALVSKEASKAEAPPPTTKKPKRGKSAPAAAAAEPAKAGLIFSMHDMMNKRCEAGADYLMEVLEGWDLDVPFSRAAVEQLCDELPGAAQDIMDAYRAAVVEGRLGN
jgi:hypothetical protein